MWEGGHRATRELGWFAGQGQGTAEGKGQSWVLCLRGALGAEDPSPGDAPLLPAGAGLGPFLPISLLGVCRRWMFLGLVIAIQLSCEYLALPARENGLLHYSFKLLLTFGYQ